ncbi:RNA-directed DNA polymerase [Flammeovirga sp. SJP92]|uniref:RNA-directed DNA polymerase n=1 Tax=Flammeovirga sp. SJP92 TaxID=1775430 RepID=UPI0007877819|nr:RNA-directed DNA polymerase [Flammeovirga sp. SJP92]KXX66793.1 hypothetical protein AVL50_30130 [Flammeovirga sp. SJP92]
MRILDMSSEDARKFLLKNSSYANFDLPLYYDFSNLLTKVSNLLKENSLSNYYSQFEAQPNRMKPLKPYMVDEVNYKFLNNKDGKYSWRPFQLINPALYVHLVHTITTDDNWLEIVNRFNTLHENTKIVCCSIPLESDYDKESDKASTILSWWNEIEQKSLELSLDFNYVIHTDIADCYGSIYTHSIPWALHGKEIAKNERSISLLGNNIDSQIRDMGHGQTNGIPQGSRLMDFIAELVLGYADTLLSDKIKSENINDYKILRYRDDYRIFTNSPVDADLIMKNLTEVLISLGMKLSSQKTIPSNDLIRSSIKPDKIYWNSIVQKRSSLQKQLLIINELSHQYPNSGSLTKALTDYFNRISKMKKELKDVKALIGIVVNIAFRNPRVYPISTGIISRLLNDLDIDNRVKLIDSILKKFQRLPNTGHIKVWLQRVTLKINRNIEYEEPLCQKVNDHSIAIWNIEFLHGSLKTIIENTSIINESIIAEMEEIIDIDEVSPFEFY